MWGLNRLLIVTVVWREKKLGFVLIREKNFLRPNSLINIQCSTKKLWLLFIYISPLDLHINENAGWTVSFFQPNPLASVKSKRESNLDIFRQEMKHEEKKDTGEKDGSGRIGEERIEGSDRWPDFCGKVRWQPAWGHLSLSHSLLILEYHHSHLSPTPRLPCLPPPPSTRHTI